MGFWLAAAAAAGGVDAAAAEVEAVGPGIAAGQAEEVLAGTAAVQAVEVLAGTAGGAGAGTRPAAGAEARPGGAGLGTVVVEPALGTVGVAEVRPGTVVAGVEVGLETAVAVGAVVAVPETVAAAGTAGGSLQVEPFAGRNRWIPGTLLYRMCLTLSNLCLVFSLFYTVRRLFVGKKNLKIRFNKYWTTGQWFGLVR